MSQKYTDARYPEKINDLMDNEGNINPEIIPPAPTPEPGLKFYRHLVSIDYEEGTPQVQIISTISTPALTGQLLDNILDQSIQGGTLFIEGTSDRIAVPDYENSIMHFKSILTFEEMGSADWYEEGVILGDDVIEIKN